MKLDLGVKLGENEKKLLAALGTVIILFVAWQFFISPQVDQIQNLSTEVDSNKAERDQLKEKFSHLDELKAQLKKDKLKFTKLQEVVPENASPEDILDNVTNLWKQSGVTLTSGVTISDPLTYTSTVTPVAGLFTSSVQITVTGKYNNILALIKNIEGSRLKFAITSYSLNGGDKGPITASFSLSTFTYNPSNKAPEVKTINEIPKFGDFNLFASGGKSSSPITAPNTAGINTKGATPYTGLVNQGSSVVGVGLGNSTTVTNAGTSGESATGSSSAEGKKGTVAQPKGSVNIKPGTVNLAKIGMDFYCILKPNSDDAPACTIGKFPNAYTELYSDLNGKEKVTLTITKQAGKLYYKYSTSNSSYPASAQEFKPVSSKLIFEIISSKRTDKNDKAEADFEINNTSGMNMDVYVVNEDPDSPRVNIVKKSNNVNVVNQ